MRQSMHFLPHGGRTMIAQMAPKGRNRRRNRRIRQQRRRRNRAYRNQRLSLGGRRFESLRRRSPSRPDRNPLERNGYPAREDFEPWAGIPFGADAFDVQKAKMSCVRASVDTIRGRCDTEEDAAEIFPRNPARKTFVASVA